MRLAVFTHQFPGRVSTFFARDMRGLIDAGIEIDVFPFYPLDTKLWRYVPEILNEKVLPRHRVHHLTISNCLRNLRLWSSRRFLRFLADTLSISGSAVPHGIESLAKNSYIFLKAWTWAQQCDNQYDHVLAYWGNYSATCAYLYHRLTTPQVPFSMFLHAHMDLYRKRVYMKRKLLYSDNIIVVCEFNRQFLRKCYEDIFPSIKHKIYPHHLGLDLEEMSYEPDGRPLQKVLAVGRLERQKGFDYLLRATSELKTRGMNIDVELVGDGAEGVSLRKLAKELGIEDRVRFRGWLDFAGVKSAMREATVLCHPSPQIGDAVPTVVKESMALGTPVIGTAVAGIPELLDQGRCGVLVPPKNVKALADGIELLLMKPELRQRYAVAARKHAEKKFDLWKNGRSLANILSMTYR